jgi:hypothetical protein
MHKQKSHNFYKKSVLNNWHFHATGVGCIPEIVFTMVIASKYLAVSFSKQPQFLAQSGTHKCTHVLDSLQWITLFRGQAMYI